MRTLVVGCFGAIGMAITRRLKQKGHQVVGADQAKGTTLDDLEAFYEVHLDSIENVSSFCSQVEASASRLWAIVYCAGVYPIVPFHEYTVSLWDQVHNVNVRAAFLICSRLHPLIEDGGRIVTIVSGAAHLGSRDVAYSASKAALLGLTKSLALNLASRGILANAVCPGPVESPMSERMPDQRVREYLDRILLQRFGHPEEVAVAVDFLLAPDNNFMTGATVDVNGGLYLR